MIFKTTLTLTVSCLTILSSQAFADNRLKFSGEINFGSRFYADDGLYAGQTEAGSHVFMGTVFNATYAFDVGEFVLRGRGKMGRVAGGRQFVLENAYYSTQFNNFDLLIGYNVENWGQAVSQSVTNVLNPVDFSDRSPNPSLIGTPMINANYTTSIGTFSGYLLTGFVGSNFEEDPGTRQRGFFNTDKSRAYFEDSDENDIDLGLRYTNNFVLGSGSVDVGVSYFNGTDRTPVLLPGCTNALGTIAEAVCTNTNDQVVTIYEGLESGDIDTDAFWDFVSDNMTDTIASGISAIPGIGFIPYYREIEQVGLELNYAVNDIQLRFEGTYTDTSKSGYFKTVVGGDYTFSDFAGTDDTMTVAVEYLYDEQGKNNPFVLFEDDIFVGVDYRTNNERDLRFNLGAFYDLSSSAMLTTAAAAMRITDSLTVEVNAQKAFASSYNDPLAFIKKDGFVELKLRSFF